MSSIIRCLLLFSYVLLVLLFSPLSSFAKHTQQTGFVKSGQNPIVSSTVTLYQTGGRHGHSVSVLGKGSTDEDGYFKISYKRPKSGKAIFYLIAEGGFLSESDGDQNVPEDNDAWSGR